MKFCLCSHPRADHDAREALEPCSRRLHPACGCDEFRLDARSSVAEVRYPAAGTEEGAA